MGKCDECERSIKGKQKSTKVKKIVEIKVRFCSDSCMYIYVERSKDDFIGENRAREQFTKGYEEGYDLGFEEAKTKFIIDGEEKTDNAHTEGFLEGIKITLESYKICPRCNKRNVESLHHIIPRKFGGTDNIENLIFLCFECHDYVEIKTCTLLKVKKKADTDTVRSYICGEFPTFCGD